MGKLGAKPVRGIPKDIENTIDEEIRKKFQLKAIEKRRAHKISMR